MKRTAIHACLCTLALAALQPVTALADADSIAARCVTTIQNTVDRAESVLSTKTQDTVQLIDRLLAVGRVEDAITAARACVSESREDMRHASNYINDVTDECIRKLVRMGEYQLARRVDYSRNTAHDQLVSFLSRQEQVLSDALDDE